MKSLFDFALKCLAEHRYTEKELTTLLEKQFQQQENFAIKLQATLARLRALELLQDKRIALSWAQRYAHKGNVFIQHRLTQKGIDDKDITYVLMHLEKEEDRAFHVLQKKFKELNAPLTSIIDTKLHAFLKGRGFSATAAQMALERLTCCSSSTSSLKRFFRVSKRLHPRGLRNQLRGFMNPLLN